VNKDDTETIDSKDKEPQANNTTTTTTTTTPLQPKANGLKRSGEGPDSRMTPDGALHGSLSSSSEGLSTSEHEHSTSSTNSKKRTTGGNLPFLSFRACVIILDTYVILTQPNKTPKNQRNPRTLHPTRTILQRAVNLSQIVLKSVCSTVLPTSLAYLIIIVFFF